MEQVSISIGSSSVSIQQWVVFGVGALLTILNLVITVVNYRMSRRRSVEDEFWFRRVVAPAVIDRAQEFALKWSTEIASSVSFRGNVKGTQAKVTECKSECSALITSFMCLKMYDSAHYISATRRADEMVDSVTECLYIISNKAFDVNEVGKKIEEKREELHASLLGIFVDMKKMQSKF
ncbi:hypothetical protein [Stenotrophomonas sp. SAU14A_NAIMI4_5]|uniref:hypothetical protein n=1 Tax=Stenotrophomonas sp. SAU14A_NAIMI4_5 TaxID=2072413 RepID=UPI00131EECC6|nr:hypothetical protein [Stenotrophomonas sp. SAU14A_NAIMI4_5]